MEKKFNNYIDIELENNEYEIYDLDGGKCALSKKGDKALVFSNGRYPEDKNKYSLNKICTEKIFVLEGEGLFTLNGCEILLKKGSYIDIKPGNKYSVTGKNLICKIEISPKWDSSQNSFVD